MGSSNSNGSGPVSTGPFAGLEDSLVRGANLSVILASRADFTDGIDTRLEYRFFNAWLESQHAQFHIAVGGSMGNIRTSVIGTRLEISPSLFHPNT